MWERPGRTQYLASSSPNTGLKGHRNVARAILRKQKEVVKTPSSITTAQVQG